MPEYCFCGLRFSHQDLGGGLRVRTMKSKMHVPKRLRRDLGVGPEYFTPIPPVLSDNLCFGARACRVSIV